MRARAPGKVVLSGAYAVLDGAPSIVAAVDRYAVADSCVRGSILTEEVKAAGFAEPYWFDASELRLDGRKLGLGSSAAILVATLAARCWERDPTLTRDALVAMVHRLALRAHREAQGGGSGIDVAAASYGGILRFQLGATPTSERAFDAPSIRALRLPASLHFEVWSSKSAASTAEMLRLLRHYAERDAGAYQRLMGAQTAAAEATAHAWEASDGDGILHGFRAQRRALQRMGDEVRIPIVTGDVARLADEAEANGAAVLPSGAGGGDIALYVGTTSSDFMLDAITRLGHARLPLVLGARGVHVDPTEERPGNS